MFGEKSQKTPHSLRSQGPNVAKKPELVLLCGYPELNAHCSDWGGMCDGLSRGQRPIQKHQEVLFGENSQSNQGRYKAGACTAVRVSRTECPLQ